MNLLRLTNREAFEDTRTKITILFENVRKKIKISTINANNVKKGKMQK
jgi:hypothetical protein